MPLSLVVAVNAIKDILEDRKLRVSDRLENNQVASVLHTCQVRSPNTCIENSRGCSIGLYMSGRTITTPFIPSMSRIPLKDLPLVETEDDEYQEYDDARQPPPPKVLNLQQRLARSMWKDLAVGEMVVTFNGEFFPADILLIASSDVRGNVFVDTSTLDGETNLKIKSALTDVQHYIYTQDDPEMSLLKTAALDLSVQCGPPLSDLRKFYGGMKLKKGILPDEIWTDLNPVDGIVTRHISLNQVS